MKTFTFVVIYAVVVGLVKLIVGKLIRRGVE